MISVAEIRLIDEVHDFVDSYIFESGEGGLYVLTDFEKNLIQDAILQWESEKEE